MTDFKRSQIRDIEEAMAYPNGFGYVLDFSDRTMGEFFEDEFGIEIYAQENLVNGSSKRNCLTTFLQRAEKQMVLRVLRALWERREGLLEARPNSSEALDAKHPVQIRSQRKVHFLPRLKKVRPQHIQVLRPLFVAGHRFHANEARYCY